MDLSPSCARERLRQHGAEERRGADRCRGTSPFFALRLPGKFSNRSARHCVVYIGIARQAYSVEHHCEVAQRKRAGPITQRSSDRNRVSQFCVFFCRGAAHSTRSAVYVHEHHPFSVQRGKKRALEDQQTGLRPRPRPRDRPARVSYGYVRYKQEVECSIWRPIAFRTGPLKMALRLDYLFDDTKSSNETMLSLDEAAVEGLGEVHLTLESHYAAVPDVTSTHRYSAIIPAPGRRAQGCSVPGARRAAREAQSPSKSRPSTGRRRLGRRPIFVGPGQLADDLRARTTSPKAPG